MPRKLRIIIEGNSTSGNTAIAKHLFGYITDRPNTYPNGVIKITEEGCEKSMHPLNMIGDYDVEIKTVVKNFNSLLIEPKRFAIANNEEGTGIIIKKPLFPNQPLTLEHQTEHRDSHYRLGKIEVLNLINFLQEYYDNY